MPASIPPLPAPLPKTKVTYVSYKRKKNGRLSAVNKKKIVPLPNRATVGGPFASQLLDESMPAGSANISSDQACDDKESDWEDDNEDENVRDARKGRKNKAKRKQGASVEMSEFLRQEQRLLDLMFESDSEENLNEVCSCGRGKADMRCQECFNFNLRCQKCICEAHVHQPFHWVQRLQNGYFIPVDLECIGLEVFLGHGGHRCHNIASGRRSSAFTVVHHNGIHTARIAWCDCPNCGDHVDQLMRAGLFPATLTTPKTVFTFQMLKQAHVHILQSKKSAYDYIWSLRRLTNNVFASDAPDRYREYNRIARVWSYLKSLKRSGQGHNLQVDLPHLPPGSLALTCPACPQEGFNMRSDSEENSGVPADLQDTGVPDYVDTLFLGADGNFHARRKNKVNKTDADDVALANGRRIFVEDAAYNKYVHDVETDPQYKNEKPPATCSGFRAGDARRAIKDKGLAVTGVIAVLCIRHGIFRPSGMVNMFVGERYHLVDYAIAKACENVKKLKIIFTYDVSCRHDKKVRKRFAMWLPNHQWILDLLTELVPKMHMLAHKVDCQYKYALDYEDGVGMTHGETVEQLWAEGNQTGGSTQEMNPGHRLDALDDFNTFWCWTKIQRLAEFLGRRLREEIEALYKVTAEFDARSESTDKDLLQLWEKEIGKAPWQENDEWHSIFKQKFGKVPSRSDILSELSQMEIQNIKRGLERKAVEDEQSRPAYKGTVAFINRSITLRLKQWDVRNKVVQLQKEFSTATEEIRSRLAEIPAESVILHSENLEEARKGWRVDLVKWRDSQMEFMPLVNASHISSPEVDKDSPETSVMGLPSDIERSLHPRLELEDLAELELKIWQGVAFDILTSLKEQIKYKSAFAIEKQRSNRGTHANTRSQASLNVLRANVKATARRYNFVRSRMIRLGLSADSSQFQHIGDGDLWMYDANSSKTVSTTKAKKKVQPVKDEPWYWKTVIPTSVRKEDRKAWSVEIDRVLWHRQRADHDRHTEEVQILKEELRRVMRTHKKFADLWRSRVLKTPTSRLDNGRNAYALRTAAMHDALRDRAEVSFRKAMEAKFVLKVDSVEQGEEELAEERP